MARKTPYSNRSNAKKRAAYRGFSRGKVYKNCLAIGVIFILSLGIAYLYYILQPQSEVLEMEVEDLDMTKQEAAEYIETAKEKMNIVLWREAYCDFGREDGESVQCTAISKVGDNRLIFPQTSLLDDKDSQGCILSKKAALDIWGSEKVVGLDVYCGEEKYIVRGIMDRMEKIAIVNISSGGKNTFRYLTSGKRGGSIQEKRQWLQTGTGISGNEWNYYILNRFLLCLIIFSIILLLIFFKKSVASIVEQTYGGRLLESLFSVFLITGIICMAMEILTISGWPARWSDFQQWSEKGEQLAEAVRFFAYSEKPVAVVWKMEDYGKALAADMAVNLLLIYLFVSVFVDRRPMPFRVL